LLTAGRSDRHALYARERLLAAHLRLDEITDRAG